ncbi:MAG TPA: alpha/beta hydrolase [Pseudonocardia sp.]|jgi:pimeloyl-ACP methyl ester carboxylesterase|nr:alpha/beta hydrolase [Pseudonocardia sp.]
MRTENVDGHRIRVHEQGSGQPLVYLHSGSGEVGPMPIFAGLADAGFRVLAPELPGFGESDKAPRWRRIEDVVLHLRRTFDVLELDSAVLVGSSFGGWLAAELAVWFPERVRALVLVDAIGLRVDEAPISDVFGGPGSDVEELLYRANPHGRDMAALMAPVYGDDPPADLPLRYQIRGMEVLAKVGWNPYMHNPLLAERLTLISAPTLVLWGADDHLVPPAHGERYAAGIPGARLELIPDCGHLPAIEQPETTASLVTAFVAEQRATAGIAVS